MSETSPAMADLETVQCPLCAGTQAQSWLHVPGVAAPHGDGALQQGAVWHLQQCCECGLVFLNPRPTDIAAVEFYRMAAYLPFCSVAPNRGAITRLYGWLRRHNLQWKRRAVVRWKGAGRLLDVGCGTGEFLQEMQGAGWEVTGVERDPAAAQFAREKLHLRVLTGSVDDLAHTGERFDVITLWHVLEHLYRPRETLRQVCQLLRDSGVVIIAVPNIASVDARFYGQHWVALDAPRHVQHFSLTTLQMMGADAGLQLQDRQQLPLDAFFNALMSEFMQPARTRSWPLLWPLRLARSTLVACASLLGGSRNVFSSGKHGATIVSCFAKAAGKLQ